MVYNTKEYPIICLFFTKKKKKRVLDHFFFVCKVIEIHYKKRKIKRYPSTRDVYKRIAKKRTKEQREKNLTTEK
jgi:hypothetical protein